MVEERAIREDERRESPADAPDPDTLTTATVGIVGTILVIVAVVFLQGLYERMSRSEFQRKIVDQAPAELSRLREAQLARLHSTAWVDRQNGFVAIPIEKAMALLVADSSLAAPIIVPAPPATTGAAAGVKK